jgi:hypothetical protein
MKPTDDELDLLLKRLHLANARRVWQQLVFPSSRPSMTSTSLYNPRCGCLCSAQLSPQTSLPRDGVGSTLNLVSESALSHGSGE